MKTILGVSSEAFGEADRYDDLTKVEEKEKWRRGIPKKELLMSVTNVARNLLQLLSVF